MGIEESGAGESLEPACDRKDQLETTRRPENSR